MHIPEEVIKELKERVPIAELIGEYTQLKPSGNKLKGKCPFHADDTASLVVYPETNSFYCFGCQAGKGDSDPIGFVKLKLNMSFDEACEYLANRYGIQITSNPVDSKKQKQYLHVAKQKEVYHKLLWKNEEALRYLHDRGLTDEDIREWGIGWMPKETTVYPQLRERVVFPIYDEFGRPVSFSGRTIRNEKPKYCNGVETEIFSKRKILYGLHKAKSAIRSENTVIVVEGFMDVISMHRAGISNTVATMGTSLSKENAECLARLVRNNGKIYLMFDGDAAGEKAALLADQVLSEFGVRPLVYSIRHNQDPDDLAKQYGKELYNMIKQNARSVTKMREDSMFSRFDARFSDIVRETIDEARPILEEYRRNNEWLEHELLISKLTERLGISREVLLNNLLTEAAS